MSMCNLCFEEEGIPEYNGMCKRCKYTLDMEIIQNNLEDIRDIAQNCLRFSDDKEYNLETKLISRVVDIQNKTTNILRILKI